MVQEIERSTRLCQLTNFAKLIFGMVYAIFFILVFSVSVIIDIFVTFFFVLLFYVFYKREIVPSINHMKRNSFEGEWIIGKVNLKTIKFTGGRSTYGYTIEGHYTYNEQIYMFQDHFYITNVSAGCAFNDIFRNEDAPTDIMILVDPDQPSKYMVKGALYMQNVHDAFLEYFEKWHYK